MKTRLMMVLILFGLISAPAMAESYVFDKKGQHAFIQFRIQHLGFSWLYGGFNNFDGKFEFDPKNPTEASVEVTIDVASIDSNHAERDKHLREDDFLDVKKYPQARFVSTEANLDAEGNGTVTGNLTLRGVTKPVSLAVEGIGAGADPWGGYRRGFHATTSFALADFGIDYDLGPASRTVELILSVEGIRQ